MRERKKLQRFLSHSEADQFMLVTLVATSGSTYNQAGTKKLVELPSGKSEGLISGGCLEQDILQFGLSKNETVFLKTFSTDSSDSDRFIGTTTGCQGTLDLLFEKLDRTHVERRLNCESMTFVSLAKDTLGLNVTVAKDSKAIRPEDSVISTEVKNRLANLDPYSAAQTFSTDLGAMYFEPAEKELQVFVHGLGPDIEPLYEILQTMGWNTGYFSHQSDLVEQRLKQGWPVLSTLKQAEAFLCPPAAVLLMSHNYTEDMELLHRFHQKLKQGLFIGLLGPKTKRDRMILDLQAVYGLSLSEKEQAQIFGPIGRGHDRGPLDIAFSAAAQLRDHFFKSPSFPGE